MDAALPDPASPTRTHVGLEQRVLARLKRLELPAAARIVVGFSGGPDSLALAAVLARLQHVSGVKVLLVHVDHGLRPESAGDAVHCRRLAAGLGLPVVAVRLAADIQRLHPGVGVEEAARRERYVALADQAAVHGAMVVAIAHHEEDQAETVLLHLLRGAGLSGAVAMAESVRLTVPWWKSSTSREPTSVHVWRPLLNEPRQIVRDYADETGLRALHDPTNDDSRFRRNRIRHEALPMLRAIDSGADAALARYARVAGEEDSLLRVFAENARIRSTRADGRLDIETLTGEHLAVQRRVVRAWLEQSGATGELSLERVDSVLAAASERRGNSRIEIGDGWTVAVSEGTLKVSRRTPRECLPCGNDVNTKEAF